MRSIFFLVLFGVMTVAQPTLAGDSKQDALVAASIGRQMLLLGGMPKADPRVDRTACTFIGVAYYAVQGSADLDKAYDFCNVLTGPEPTRAEALASLAKFINK